jgi:hypothetical protein
MDALCAPFKGATVDDIKFMHSLFFGDTKKAHDEAKAMCIECPMQIECLRGAIERNEPDGVWGGLTAKERKQLRKRMQ